VAGYRNDVWLDELKGKVRDNKELREFVNKKGIRGWTPLHCAASHNNHQNIKWLLLNGADVDAKSYGSKRADVYGNKESKRILRKHRK